MVFLIPVLNPLALGQMRTEILEEIWDYIRTNIRELPVAGIDTGQPIHALNEDCEFNQFMQVHFRKDDFPGNYGQDQNDNSRVNAIFASERNDWIIANGINQPQDFNLHIANRYHGQVGVAICRRQKIEKLIQTAGHYCDIDTWLLFLCMRDDDVQENQLIYPQE